MSARILVVDDDILSLKLIAHHLRDTTYVVETASNGEEAWELVVQNPPDLIICDWSMPGMSGIELCQKIKADLRLQLIYFILLTVRLELPDRVAGLENGADDYISKPVAPEELIARIRVGLRLRQVTKSLQEANQQLRLQNELLQSLTLMDQLTGVLNRRALETGLPGLLQKVGDRSEGSVYRYLSVWIIDIDHFKTINDTYGHLIGDKVLQIVAQRLQSNSLPGSFLYRYGGEEFVSVMPGINPLQALAYGEQLRLAIALEPVCLMSVAQEIPVTISLGGAMVHANEPISSQMLLSKADRALYQAKAMGRNQAILSGLERC